MNKAILMGRLTKEPELRTTQSNISVCSFTVACDRRFKNADGSRGTDFINCVAWRQTAEFIARYFHKGNRILVCGMIQTRSWEDQTGQRRYTTEVVVDEAHFCESKNAAGGSGGQGEQYGQQATTFASGGQGSYLPDSDEDGTELPFDL